MTDENTLPEGWTVTEHCIPYNEDQYTWEHETLPPFVSKDWLSGIRLARALSSPTIEDAKAELTRHHAMATSTQTGSFGKGYALSLLDSIDALDNLAPTPEPDVGHDCDAPAEIWACPDDDEWISGSWDLASDGQGPEVLYVRGDLVAPKPDLTQNTTPFELLPKETQEAFKALPSGAVQIWAGKRWIGVPVPEWGDTCTYRQDPYWTQKPLTKPAVPWDVLADEIVAVTRREDGRCYAHTEVPRLSEDLGQWVNGHAFPMKYLAGFDPGTCDWRDSLVQRPKGDE